MTAWKAGLDIEKTDGEHLELAVSVSCANVYGQCREAIAIEVFEVPMLVLDNEMTSCVIGIDVLGALDLDPLALLRRRARTISKHSTSLLNSQPFCENEDGPPHRTKGKGNFAVTPCPFWL